MYYTRHVDAGWSSLVARRAHNPKVVGSNPAPATKFKIKKVIRKDGLFYFLLRRAGVCSFNALGSAIALAITIERFSVKPEGWLQRQDVANKSSPLYDLQKVMHPL